VKQFSKPIPGWHLQQVGSLRLTSPALWGLYAGQTG